jgi:hypothetical protein
VTRVIADFKRWAAIHEEQQQQQQQQQAQQEKRKTTTTTATIITTAVSEENFLGQVERHNLLISGLIYGRRRYTRRRFSFYLVVNSGIFRYSSCDRIPATVCIEETSRSWAHAETHRRAAR